jgi:hypothetical protein
MQTMLPLFASRVVAWLCAISVAMVLAWSTSSQALERLKFNNPGLVVDLGVGLWAWPVPCDADGDGDFDLVVVCPDKPYNGTWLFENATGSTAKNKFPVFKPARRLGKGINYATPSYVDGQVRVLRPNFEYPDFLTTGLDSNVRLPVAGDKIHKFLHDPPRGRASLRHNQWRYVDFDGDGALDLVVAIEDWTDYGWDNAYDPQGRWTNGPLHGLVYVLRNIGTTVTPKYVPAVTLEAGGQRLDTFGCPSPNFFDFDRDGDLDLLCGEFLDGFTYFENLGTRTAPRYAPGRRLKTPTGEPLTMDLEMIVPVAFDWDSDGDADLIVGDEDGRVALVENTGQLAGDRTPQFLAPRYFQQEADDVKFGALATPVGVDWDCDGDFDIISGNTAGYIAFIENLSGPAVEPPKWAAPLYLESEGKRIRIMAGPNGSIQGPAEAKWGYTTQSVADWDGDGLPDILVNSILGKIVWYRNVGTRSSPKLAAAQPIEVEWDGPQPALAWGWVRPEGKALLAQWRTTPVAVDWNHDGLIDLVMLDHEGFLAFFPRAKRGGQVVLLPPQRVLCDDQKNPLQLSTKSAGGSGRRKLSIVDWDGDGRLDLLLNSSNANVLSQLDAHDGQWFFKDMGPLDQRNIEGHDVSPTTVDFNGDGVPDFLGGAEDGHFYYLRNPRAK